MGLVLLVGSHVNLTEGSFSKGLLLDLVLLLELLNALLTGGDILCSSPVLVNILLLICTCPGG